MATPDNVQSVDINDPKRNSPAARVNLPPLDSKGSRPRMNCYEQGQVTPLHMHPDDGEVGFCVEERGAVTRGAGCPDEAGGVPRPMPPLACLCRTDARGAI